MAAGVVRRLGDRVRAIPGLRRRDGSGCRPLWCIAPGASGEAGREGAVRGHRGRGGSCGQQDRARGEPLHLAAAALERQAGLQLYRRIMLLAFVFAGDRISGALAQAADVPFSLSLAQSSLSSVAYAALIISILLIRTPPGEGKTPPGGWAAFMRGCRCGCWPSPF